VDIRKLKKLIDLVKESGVFELEIREKDEAVRITTEKSHEQQVITAPTVVTATPTAKEPEKKPETRHHTVKSPMVGTVYLSASPGAKSFVEVGQVVKAGDTLCLIEAMKMFNRIEADKAGVIVNKLVENEQAVEYGQALFEIE
jgi:acetyl-CoA carboxylase biotin carboxyl carrier protein